MSEPIPIRPALPGFVAVFADLEADPSGLIDRITYRQPVACWALTRHAGGAIG